METSKKNDENHSQQHEPQGCKDGREQMSQGDNHDSEKVDQDNKALEGSAQPSNHDLFPWKYTPKWPVTRGERIQQLKEMAPFYENTPQKENIAAAIDWHAQFDADEFYPMDIVMFQKGKKIERADLERDGGAPWGEGCVMDLMTGNPSIQPAPMSSGVHSSNAQKTDWTDYNRRKKPLRHQDQRQ